MQRFASGNNTRVIGVLFSFDPAERAKLDEAEGVGRGYEYAMVTVINEKGRRRKVLTYIATIRSTRARTTTPGSGSMLDIAAVLSSTGVAKER